MLPEQAKGNPVGPASGIFSLGAVLCLAATGRAPFGVEGAMVVPYRIVHEPSAIDAIPAPLRDLIGRCLAKDPALRPAPAELMREFTGGGAVPYLATGSFWPPDVARRVRDFSAGLDKRLSEPVPVAPTAQPARVGFVTQASSGPVAGPTQPPRAEPTAQAASISRPRGRRRELVIGGGLTLAIVALLLVLLLPGSSRQPGSGLRADAATTQGATQDRQPTKPGTATSRPASVPPAQGVALKCGSSCITLYNSTYGESEVLGIMGTAPNAGEGVGLQQASSSDTAKDWVLSVQGTVSKFFAGGLTSSLMNSHYGSYHAYEYEYAPGGAPSGLCFGAAANAQAGAPVTLQPCGVSARTIWVADSADPDGQLLPLINGTDTNSTQPLVLTDYVPGKSAIISSLSGAIGQYWRTEN
jgi:hypothetical protein